MRAAAIFLTLMLAVLFAGCVHSLAGEKWTLQPRWEDGDDRWANRWRTEDEVDAHDVLLRTAQRLHRDVRDFEGPFKKIDAVQSYWWIARTTPRLVLFVFISPSNFEHMGTALIDLPSWWDRDRQGMDFAIYLR